MICVVPGYGRYRRRHYGVRRGYGIRRRGRMSFGRKRAKLNVVRRKLIGGAVRAATQQTTSTPMCRDLGNLWPGCVTVKLKMHFASPLTSSAGAIAAGYNYQHQIVCYPYRPLSAGFGAITGYTDGSNKGAGGWARLISAASGVGPYSECCVLKMQYNLRYDTQVSMANQGTTNAAVHVSLPWTHYVRVYDSTSSMLTAPTTQAQLDDNISSAGKVYYKEAGKPQTVEQSTITAGNNAIVQEGSVTRFKGTVWPHKALDYPFDQYVSQANSFGTNNSNPAEYALLELGGFANRTATTATAPTDIVVIRGMLVFTCLFKEPCYGSVDPE